MGTSLTPELERIAIAVLARAPRIPRDPALFSSNPLFGEPGIYPDGPVMVPAAGPALDADAARAALRAIACPGQDRFEDRALVERADDPGVRAGLVALCDTIAEPLLDAFIDGTTPVRHFALGAAASPGRVIGPPAHTPDGDIPHADDPDIASGTRVVNERYRAEHPALLALSLTHDLLWRAREPNQIEEATLHALGAMVHLQLVARTPGLAHLGTELARRQNALALTLLDSRRPGRADISVVAPDGPGTIPGGDPAMQSPDFWSIPFVSAPPPSTPPDAPALLGACLTRIAGSGAPRPTPLRYEPSLGTWLSEHLGREWLPVDAQLRAAVALGAVDEHDLASASGLDVSDAMAAFGVDAAAACFTTPA